MTHCLLPNLSGYKRLGEPLAQVEYDPMDLLRFIPENSCSAAVSFLRGVVGLLALQLFFGFFRLA